MIARRLLMLLLCLGFIAHPSWAEAAPSAKEKATAKTAWTLGKRLALQGKHEEAAGALREAVKNDPKVQYQLDFARSLVKIKSFVEASELADAVIASQEPNAQRAKQVAAQLKKDIDARIPTLKIEVSGAEASAASVTVNGETAEIGKALRFDPGSYTVRGRTGSQPEVTERLELAESEHRTVTLSLGKSTEPAPTEPKTSGGGNMAPAAVLYAVGGVGLVIGAVMGVLAFNKTGEVEELCGGTVCPPELADEVALAQDYGTASTVAFAIGGLGVAAAIILTFTVGLDSGDAPAAEKKEVSVTPYIGPLGAGVRGTF